MIATAVSLLCLKNAKACAQFNTPTRLLPDVFHFENSIIRLSGIEYDSRCASACDVSRHQDFELWLRLYRVRATSSSRDSTLLESK